MFLKSKTGYYKLKLNSNKNPFIQIENSLYTDNFRLVLPDPKDRSFSITSVSEQTEPEEFLSDVKNIIKDKINLYMKKPGTYMRRNDTFLKQVIGDKSAMYKYIVVTPYKLYITRYNTNTKEKTNSCDFNSFFDNIYIFNELYN
jgi:hypothetical protein